MGFFDRFAAKKPEAPPASPATVSASGTGPAPTAHPEPAAPPPAEPVAPAPTTALGVKARLEAAREKLEARDLPGAMVIYEEILGGGAGDRADVLVAISGDLGSHGHVAEIIELIAARYDAERHGPATGLNLLQAYLAVRNADAAQHVLDILFALKRPELEERLYGFSNAIAELLVNPNQLPPGGGGAGLPGDAPKIGLITISKPIWFYGLEALATQVLPPKEGRLRHLAFAQLALPGRGAEANAEPRPDDELGRLALGLPLWFAETFYFSPQYAPVAAVAFRSSPEGPGGNRPVTFGAEWTIENLRQLVETSGEGVDYIVTGALRAAEGDYELVLRVWEVRTFRERKVFQARWTPATADSALAKLHAELRAYMEWSPASAAFAYVVPARPRAWLDTLAASLGLFLVEKSILPADQLAPVETDLRDTAQRAAQGEAASLAFLTLRARATRLGLAAAPEATLARSPLVNSARETLAAAR